MENELTVISKGQNHEILDLKDFKNITLTSFMTVIVDIGGD